MHDRVRGFDRGPGGDIDGGGPVEIGSHLAPHLRVSHSLGVNCKVSFILQIRWWRDPLDHLITDLTRASSHTWLGDNACDGNLSS